MGRHSLDLKKRKDKNRIVKKIIALAITIAMTLIVVGCSGSTTKTTRKPTTKKPKPKVESVLKVVNSWFVDNLTHQEPMVVGGVTSSSENVLFVVLIASDSGQGPERGGPPLDGHIQNVEGGGLTWTRRVDAHLSNTGAPGIAEVWTAFATKKVTPFDLKVTRNDDTGALTHADNYEGGSGPDISNGMVYVQVLTGADPKNPIGAIAFAGTGNNSGRVESPSVTFNTTRAGSIVVAVGEDWSNPATRTPGAGQIMLHEDVSSPNGDSYWVQGLSAPVAQPSSVTLSVTSEPEHNCNMAAVEILRAL